MSEVQAGTATAGALLERILTLRAEVESEAAPILARFAALNRTGPALDNLAHYLALRHRDLRDLQRELMWRGLSSLGRIESRVMPTLDAVAVATAALAGEAVAIEPPRRETYFAGEARLATAAERLFGPSAGSRRSRIMVTLPSEAADDGAFVVGLARRGMDVARINCAHDDAGIWAGMARNVRAAAESVGRPLKVLMEVAGPKIRTGAVAVHDEVARLRPGDVLRLVDSSGLAADAGRPFCATLTIPDILPLLLPDHRVSYDDGKLEGVVETIAPGEAVVRIARAKKGGVRLKADKGLNFPDTPLDLPPLTHKDERDLAVIASVADIVGYSFISRPEDVDTLEQILARGDAGRREIGIIAKIELPEAVSNLPDLIARATRNRPFGVMIARGDLAAQLGFERLAEMQEEILWICEAASVPAIWATQVLEDLVRDGVPSRGEMTDAAMAGRAECVMLNKGPAIAAAVELLDGLLSRMDEHMLKKTPRLRQLASW